ncbi:MAG: hypothetical protein ABI577_08045 [bacterium]
MAWMFRWFEGLLAHLRSSESKANAWVEPSNAITRAILSGAVAALPALPLEQEPGDIVPLPQRTTAPAAPVTRTAQRVKRRRAGRAA